MLRASALGRACLQPLQRPLSRVGRVDPLWLLGPQDRPPRHSPITDQGREPPAEPHKWASGAGLTSGRTTWKCILGAEISFAAADRLEAPLVSSGQERSLSVAGVPVMMWAGDRREDVLYTWFPAPRAP